MRYLGVAGLGAAFAFLAASAVTPDANRGRELFDNKCSGCHAVERVKVGPPVRDIFGRPAARDSHFTYSDELKRAHLVWDEATLDKWLADPDSLVPGNDMSFRLSSASERADIIAYLKQLSRK